MEGIDYIAAATLASIDVAESASLQAADGQRRSTHAKQPVEAPPAKDLATVARDAVKHRRQVRQDAVQLARNHRQSRRG